MSRYFQTSADHLDNASPPISTTPFSMSAWLLYTTPVTQQQLMSIGTTGSGLQRWTLGLATGGACNVVTRDTVTTNAVSGITMPLNQWCLLTGTYAAGDAQRTAYANGGNQGVDIFIKSITAPNGVRVSGDNNGGSVLLYAYVAHIGVWSVELSDSDVAALFVNPPSYVRPESLLEYWPLTQNLSPEPSSGLTPHDLIVTGTLYSTEDPFGTQPSLMGQAVF